MSLAEGTRSEAVREKEKDTGKRCSKVRIRNYGFMILERAWAILSDVEVL
jgi:hypothetical protein